MSRKIWSIVLGVLLAAAAAAHADELTPERKKQFESQEALRRWMMQLQPSLKYEPGPAVPACSNADFETNIEPETVWKGGAGSVVPSPGSGEPDFANFTSGIQSGPLTSPNARQTWVGAGTDPNVGISTVAPTGSTHSVRLGNTSVNYGSELLSQTFVVPASKPIIGFWYAVVLEDPAHQPHEQPAFSVRVLDAGGNEIHGVADLGNGGPKVVASQDPFFLKKPASVIVYRDWSCAQIDLRNYIGQQVTVQFVTEDCSQSAHWGYAYIDDFCGSCGVGGSSGSVSLDVAGSTACGPGQLCFDYTLPVIGSTTGSVVISLSVSQNGIPVPLPVPITSGPLSSGNNHCFPFDPATIPGLSPGPFEVTATGQFSITVGSQTSQYQLSTDPIPYSTTCGNQGCCPGPNLITNGDFESGNSGFVSDFTFVPTPGAVLPGDFAIVNSAQASSVSSSWNVQNPGSCSATGRVLVVNGATGQSGSRRVWAQTVPVTPGREYRFCASFRNLPQCNLDVKPDVEIRFSVPSSVTSSVINANASNGCDWISETRSVVIPAGVTSLTAEIWLDESGLGDGNDLAIDDLSLHEMQKAPAGDVLVNIASSLLTTSSYNITATPPPQTMGYYWEVCEVDSAGNCLAATRAVNPPEWWVPGANNFKGYVGSGALDPLQLPGVFDVGKKYKIVYGVFDTCTSFTSSTWYFSFNLNSRRVEVERALR